MTFYYTTAVSSWGNGLVRGKWEWTPVFKKGDRQQAKNYRPITSLVTVNKTFEHMLSKQVTGHYDPTLYPMRE